MEKRIKYHMQLSVIIETATLHAGATTRSRLKTYILDASRCIHGAMHRGKRGRVSQSSMIIYTVTLLADTCTMRRLITYRLHGFIKLDPWSNACARKGRV